MTTPASREAGARTPGVLVANAAFNPAPAIACMDPLLADHAAAVIDRKRIVVRARVIAADIAAGSDISAIRPRDSWCDSWHDSWRNSWIEAPRDPRRNSPAAATAARGNATSSATATWGASSATAWSETSTTTWGGSAASAQLSIGARDEDKATDCQCGDRRRDAGHTNESVHDILQHRARSAGFRAYQVHAER